MLHKMNKDDESVLQGLFQEYYGPTIAQCGPDEKIWAAGAIAKAIPGQDLRPGEPDSLDKIEFMMAVEEQFGVTIADGVAELINTRGELERVLGELLDTKRRDPH